MTAVEAAGGVDLAHAQQQGDTHQEQPEQEGGEDFEAEFGDDVAFIPRTKAPPLALGLWLKRCSLKSSRTRRGARSN